MMKKGVGGIPLASIPEERNHTFQYKIRWDREKDPTLI